MLTNQLSLPSSATQLTQDLNPLSLSVTESTTLIHFPLLQSGQHHKHFPQQNHL